MRLIIISIIGVLVHISQAYEQSDHRPHRLRTRYHKRSTHKRGVYVGDLSFSYAATDVGSINGSHVKTLTVIKNLALPKQEKNNYHNEAHSAEWVKDHFKHDIPTIPEFPDFPSFGFDEPQKVEEKSPSTEIVPKKDIEIVPESKAVQAGEEAVNEAKIESAPMANEEKLITIEAKDSLPALKTEKPQAEALHGRRPQEASDDVEYVQSTDDNIKSKSQKYSQVAAALHRPFDNDEFSDYAMHNVRHLNDPSPKKKVNNIHASSRYEQTQDYTRIQKTSSKSHNNPPNREEFREDPVELVPLNVDSKHRHKTNSKHTHPRIESEQEYRGRYESPVDEPKDKPRNPKHEDYEPNEGYHSTHESLSSSEQEYQNKYGEHNEFRAKYQVNEQPKYSDKINNNPFNPIPSTTQQPYKAPKLSQPFKPFIPSQPLPSKTNIQLESYQRAQPISSTTQKPYLAPNVKTTYQIQTRFEYVNSKPPGAKVKPTKNSQRPYLAPSLNFQPRPSSSTSTTQKPPNSNDNRQTQYLAPGSLKVPKQVLRNQRPLFTYDPNTPFLNTQRSPVQFPVT